MPTIDDSCETLKQQQKQEFAGVWGLAPISEGGSAAVARKPLRLVMGGDRPPISTQPRGTAAILPLSQRWGACSSRVEVV